MLESRVLTKDYTKVVIKALHCCTPTKLHPDSTLFSVGYEAAKAEIAERIIQELGLRKPSPIEEALFRLGNK